ncbi:DUF1772 domain-containing protein [Streptomyces sp. NPDC020965]|uniref:DUF1772 domain-containing protein n=1 Tax=Streptomyces sp. NPDC020965 TaxID=3365105 RepID=UPI00379D2A7B
MATVLLALAIISTGLYAGFMLSFQTAIMPALARLDDDHFLAAMRRVNEVVPRPLFLLTFFSIIVFPAVSLAVPVDGRSDTQRWLLVAGLACSVINHLVTVAGNVPLNNALAASERASEEASKRAPEQSGRSEGSRGSERAGESVSEVPGERGAQSGRAGADRAARMAFEPRWNRLHLIRTLFTLAAFALVVSSAL